MINTAKRRKHLVLAIGLALTAHAASAAEPAQKTLLRLDGSRRSIAEIEQRIPELMAEVWLPGMSVVVVNDGEVAYRRSFGVRNAGTGAAITPRTSFTGLSFSKTITAYLTMRLVDQELIDLDRPLFTYLEKPLPEYPFYTDLAGDSRWQKITARQVLSHTTGWPNWRWFTDDGSLSFLFDPGSRHSYSGEGFAYLQLVLEELTGEGFAALAQREVFAPLGMQRSSMLWQPAFADDYAEDHDLLGRPQQRERWDEASAAGSLQTTIDDYTRFLLAVMSGEGLQPPAHELMLSPQVSIRHARMFGPRILEQTTEHESTRLAWTLGWGRLETPLGTAIFHTGNDRGSANYTIAFPDRRSAVVLMGNSNRLEGIAQDVVELLTGDRSSPFDYLGYQRWDGPHQQWLRTLAEDGVTAGRNYWLALGERRPRYGLDQQQAFADAVQAVTHFRDRDESLAFFKWQLEIFPYSAQVIRDHSHALLDSGRDQDALDAIEHTVRQVNAQAPHLAAELEWFTAWLRALVQPAEIALEQLAAVAGEYEARRFELRDERLFYGRDETQAEDYSELIPMGDDTFVLRGADFFRLRFERDETGRAIAVTGLYEDGRTDANSRSDG